MKAILDRRLHAVRPDRADEALRGQVEVTEFVRGTQRRVVWPLAPLRRRPEPDAPLDTEGLLGEAVTVFETTEGGWAWVKLGTDGYVGYMPNEALGDSAALTHRVTALRTFVYPGPNMKLPVTGALSLGSRCHVDRTIEGFAATPGGFVWAGHLGLLEAAREPDFVAVAERFLGVPYLWGGKSSLGLDCSALVQVALAAVGRPAPRDSDLQEGSLGMRLAADAPLSRGDLVFWRGHVGIMRSPTELLHATAHTMDVTSEPLGTARGRIRERTGADISSVRRL